MSRQSNGTYQQPANTAAVSGQTISSTAYNTLITDIGNEITNSLDRGGRSAMTAALPMGGQKITGMADPASATDACTKQYTDGLVGSFFSTGDAKLTLKTVADSGWVMCDDTSVGNTGSSGAHTGAAYQALFNLLYNNLSDAAAPVYTAGSVLTSRAAQGSASAAWAAGCGVQLPKTLGRALVGAGAGVGLTNRPLGTNFGEESHILSASEIPSHYHTASISDPGHSHTYTAPAVITGGQPNTSIYGTVTTGTTSTATTGVRLNSSNGLDTTSSIGGGLSHNNTQASVAWNVMLKL